MKENVQRFNYDLAVRETLEETANRVPDYTRDQLHRGEKVDGSKITPLYGNPEYSKLKFADNSAAGLGVPDLYLYGDFYNGIQTKINTKTISTFSIDSKSPKLELKYSPLIYGLNAANKTKYAIMDVKPVLIAKVKTGIFG